MMMQDNEKMPYPVNPFKAVEEQQKKLKEVLNFDPFKNIRHIIGGGERGADIGELSGINEITNQNRINIKAIVRQELWELNKVKVEDNGTPPAEAEEKKKVGRPSAKKNPLHDNINKEFLRLTVTNPTTISISSAKRRLIEITYRDFFKNYSTDESKLARLNFILRTNTNNN